MPCHVSFLPSTTSSFIPLFFPSCFHSSFCSALFFPTCLPLFYPYFHFHLVSPYFLCLYFLPSSSPPYFTFLFLLFPVVFLFFLNSFFPYSGFLLQLPFGFSMFPLSSFSLPCSLYCSCFCFVFCSFHHYFSSLLHLCNRLFLFSFLHSLSLIAVLLYPPSPLLFPLLKSLLSPPSCV